MKLQHRSEYFLLKLISIQKQSCSILSETLSDELQHMKNENLTLLSLTGQCQQQISHHDSLILINQCLSHAQSTENHLHQERAISPSLEAFNQQKFLKELKQIQQPFLIQKSLVFLFQSLYSNKVSNAHKFIRDHIVNDSVSSKRFLQKFAFRLIYELIKRDYVNKAYEVITAVGFSHKKVLKGILFNTSNQRIHKVLSSHLRHSNKLTVIENQALQIQGFFEYLFPIKSAIVQSLKLQSLQGPQLISQWRCQPETEERDYSQIYIILNLTIDVQDLNYFVKDPLKNFTLRKLEKPGFIDTIFEFREEHRRYLLNEDDCFSRDKCELISDQPKCEKCSAFVVNFEDPENAFQQNSDLSSLIELFMLEKSQIIDTGYMLIHTNWIIDFLTQNQNIDLNNDILFPIVLSKFRGKQKFNINFPESLRLQSLLDYAIRNNDYDNLNELIKINHLKQNYRFDGSICSKMLRDTFTDVLTHKGLFDEDEKTDFLINKLAFTKSLIPRLSNEIITLLQTPHIDSNVIQRIKQLIQNNRHLIIHSKIDDMETFANIYNYLKDQGLYHVGFTIASMSQLSANYQDQKVRKLIKSPLFEFYRSFQEGDIVRASDSYLDYLKSEYNQASINEPLVKLLSFFFEKQGIINFKSQITELNADYRVISQLLSSQFDTESQVHQLSSSSRDVSIDLLISLIQQQNHAQSMQAMQKLIEQSYQIQPLLKLDITKYEAIKYFIMQGRPWSCFQYIKGIQYDGIEIQLFELAINNVLNDQITSGCIFLMKLLNIDCSLIKIDISVAKRIIEDRVNLGSRYFLNQLIQLHTNFQDLKFPKYEPELIKQANTYLEITNLFLFYSKAKKENNHDLVFKQLHQILKLLEKATWNIEDSDKKLQIQDDMLSEQQSQNFMADNQGAQSSEKKLDSPWHLVSLFCKVHELPPSLTLLHELARKNDWIMFLYEAQQQQCPKDTVVDIINDYFQTPKIKKNLKVIFKEVKKITQSQDGNVSISQEFEVLQDPVFQNLNPEKLFQNVYHIFKHLKKQNKLHYIGQYLLIAGFITRKIDYLIFCQQFVGSSVFSLIFVSLHIILGCNDRKQKYQLCDFQQLLLKCFFNGKILNMISKLFSLLDPASPIIDLEKWMDLIEKDQFSSAHQLLLQILESASKNKYIVGRDSQFINQITKSCLIQFLYQFEGYSIEKKGIISQIACETYPNDKLFNLTNIKLRYGYDPNQDTGFIVQDLSLSKKQFDQAREFINDYYMNSDSLNIEKYQQSVTSQQIQYIIEQLNFCTPDQFIERQRIIFQFEQIIHADPLVIEILFGILLNNEQEQQSIQQITIFDKILVAHLIQKHMIVDDDEGKDLQYDIRFIKEMLMYSSLDVFKSLKSPYLHSEQLIDFIIPLIDLQPLKDYQPNLSLLLSRERSLENIQFLEQLAINLLNLNMQNQVFKYCQHFSMDLSLLRKIKILNVRLDQQISSKAAYNNQLLREIQQSQQELKNSYPSLKDYILRTQNIQNINQIFKFTNPVNLFETKDMQTEFIINLVNQIEDLKEIDKIQLVKQYIDLSNLNQSDITNHIVGYFSKQYLELSNTDIKIIISTCSPYIDTEQLLDILKEQPLLSTIINIQCIIRQLSLDQCIINSIEYLKQSTNHLIEMLDIHNDQYIACFSLILHKININTVYCNQQFEKDLRLSFLKAIRHNQKLTLQLLLKDKHALQQINELFYMENPTDLIVFQYYILSSTKDSLKIDQFYMNLMKNANQQDVDQNSSFLDKYTYLKAKMMIQSSQFNVVNKQLHL